MTHQEMIDAIDEVLRWLEPSSHCTKVLQKLKAALEVEPLAEGMGAEYGHTGVWMVWSGELGQLPWLKEPAVHARRVAIYADA